MKRLNVCCGERILDGYVNIDVVAPETGPGPDIVCNALAVPLPDGCASEIMCIHGFEHFYRWEADKLLAEWKRLLQIDGVLVLELPNLIKCCENVINGRAFGSGKHPDQAGMWGLYGDPRLESPFMCHRWGWTPQTLRVVLEQHGFRAIEEQPTVFHPAGRVHRDMRVIARRA